MMRIAFGFLLAVWSFVFASFSPRQALVQVGFGKAVIPNFLGANSVKGLASMLINFLIFIGIIATGIIIVYAGITMLTAVGNEAKYSKAKSILTWAVIGFIILLLAKAFMLLVANFVGVGLPVGVP